MISRTLILINSYTKLKFGFLNKKEMQGKRTNNALWATHRGMYVITHEQALGGIRGESMGTKKGSHRETLEECLRFGNIPVLGCRPKLKLEHVMD